ncbi:WAT1-related protein At4g08290-like [Phalaenopsis equestris]|uniref:WAT1-related protein At4g08290-like n=1 Tax=Phalaenopsis equestris TaxID=78828 RepID=UPI0009E36ED3|nr:WAT1-related protein At4g08290-like [Phalaenopsis equestris]
MTMAISNKSLKVLPKVKPYFYMVLQQFLLAVMYVLAEATLKNGMSQFVLVVYRNIVGALFIAPFAFCKRRPRITVAIFLKIVALAILDPVLQQNSFYVGAKMTSASFASALENIIPAITYLMVLALRMEKLEIKRRFCQAKVIGTIANVAGAVLMIVYQGPNLPFPWNFNRGGDQNNITEAEGSSNWLQGTFFIIASNTSWSLFLILLSNTLESFPAELSLTVLICSMGAVMSAVVALVVQLGDLRPWVVGWDSRLFVSVYAL